MKAARAAVAKQESFIESITHQGELYALVVRASLPHQGYNFVTGDDCSLQVGVNHYEKGAKIRPHFHLPVNRSLHDTLEVLHFDSGGGTMTLYDQNKKKFCEVPLGAGDTVVLLRGGHSFVIGDRTRIIEVKQGPYLGPEKDKVFFEG